MDLRKPERSEYPEYARIYVDRVQGADILAILESQLNSTRALLSGLSEAQGNKRYEPGKWSIKEVVGHIADTERVFGYRALRFARNDNTALPGFDQDTFAAHADFAKRNLTDIIREYEAVRGSTLSLYRNLDDAAWDRGGVANDNPSTVRGIAFVTAGHELHHIAILKDRYL